MALRDKLRQRAQPFLEPGEQIQAVFLAQTGPSPWFAALSWLIVLFGAKYYVVVATDRNIVLLKASPWVPSNVKGIDRRLPRSTRFGPLSGIWGTSQALGTKTHIHKRFHGDVEVADSMAGATTATPAGWYPDPNGVAAQRYWDGAAWAEHTA